VRSRPTRPAAALAGGVLVALSMPPWGWWPLAFVGVVVFELVLGDDPSPRDRALLGLAFGAGWFYPAMAWMWFLTVPGYLLTALLFAGLHAAAAALAPSGPWRTLGRPAAHTLVEVVRLAFPFGGVPVATLAIGQAGGPLLGLARIGGVVVITWVVFQVGCSLAGPAPAVPRFAARRRPGSTGQPHGVLGLAAVVVLIALSGVAPEGADTGTAVRIAAVQGGGEQGTRALDVPSDRVTAGHIAATETIEPGDADLVVWPENAIDVDDEPFPGSAEHALVAAEAARLGVPLVVGVTEDSEFSLHPAPGRFVNAQVVVLPDGTVVDRYEKVQIVPFGEYVPFRGVLEALGAPVDQVPSDAIAGLDPAVISAPVEGAGGTGRDVDMGVMISWEVFFGDRGRAAAEHDAQVLLNPTNGASYTWTILQGQQVASSRLRAVEQGRWIVQVAPTGFSAFVSPDGDVYDRTGTREQAVIVRDIPLREGSTWYHTLTDWPWVTALVALFAAAHAARRRTPRDDSVPERSSAALDAVGRLSSGR
jgi:apolipoprotein N-acyltransferase